jgi:hypothetical protein
MRALMTVCFFGMAVAHLIDLNSLRYAIIVGVTALLFLVGRKVFLTNHWWYNIGSVMVIAGSAVPSFMYGDTLSYAYVLFGVLNFFLYPGFQKIELTNAHLAVIFFGLSITLIPLGLGNRIASGGKSLYAWGIDPLWHAVHRAALDIAYYLS